MQEDTYTIANEKIHVHVHYDATHIDQMSNIYGICYSLIVLGVLIMNGWLVGGMEGVDPERYVIMMGGCYHVTWRSER
jgi:hypothetical protein